MLKSTPLLLLFLLCAVPAHADVLINEILVSNQDGLRDDDGDTSDWIELYNNCDRDVPLGGWFLTDNPSNRFKWEIPDVTLGAGEFLVIFASGKDRRNRFDVLHTNFNMQRDGEFLALVDPFGDFVSQFSPLYPPQRTDTSYGVRQLSSSPGSVTQPSSREFFATPTPHTFNGTGLAGIVPEPTFSLLGGVYSSSLPVVIEAAPGSTAFYTLDGSEPGESSPMVPETLFMPTTTTELRVKAFQPGLWPSNTVSHGFVQIDADLHTFETNLPIVMIDTFGQALPNLVPFGREEVPLIPSFIRIVEPDESGRAVMSADHSFAGRGGIKPRGSSTAGREKASLSVEIWDAFDEDRDVSLVGMPAESDWVLQGPLEFDRAMMRNPFIYKLGRQMDHPSPRVRFVEVFLNTNSGRFDGGVPFGDYFGVYFLVEKIKRNADRVDVARMFPSDTTEPAVTGGYIWKLDRLDPFDVGFTGGGQFAQWVYPKEENLEPAQHDWLVSYLDQFRDVLNSPNFTDPDTGYLNYIDRKSWIDEHIIRQFSKDPDGFAASTYLHKDRGGKITLGPLWDFDRTMGSDFDLRSADPAGWRTYMFSHPWWNRLFQDPDFWVAWRDRWHELRQGLLSYEGMSEMIDSMAVELGEAYVRNYTRWQSASQMGPSNWPNEVEQLRDWQVQRVNWMDTRVPATPVFSQTSQIIEPGFELQMSTSLGAVLYTLDGTDPRVSGGGVSPTAFEFGIDSTFEELLSPGNHSGVRVLVPQDGNLGTSWTALSFADSGWQLSAVGIGVGYETSSGYESLIDFDVQAAMSGLRTSVYMRYTFNATNPARYRAFRLRMKYDDGFVAYLNGQQIAASPNVPLPPAWNTADFPLHDDTLAVTFEVFDVTPELGALREGINVLAVHGLNRTTDSSDLIFVPELLASESEPAVAALVLDEPVVIRARTRNGDQWSALVTETFAFEGAEDLRVTELQYHPADPPPESPYDDNDFEFVEVQNVGAGTLDLTGVRLTGAVEFDFDDGAVSTLGSFEYAVLVRDLAAFETRYSTAGVLIVGEYAGSLENQGERVRLENLVGATIQEFVYDDVWYPETDGGGRSLVIADAFAELDMWSTQSGWKASLSDFGTPGQDDTSGAGLQIPGDANQNSKLEIGDVTGLLFMLFAGAPSPCEGATAAAGGNAVLLDANGDALVNASDAVHVLTYLYLAGSPHVLGTHCFQIGGCGVRCGP